MGQAYSYLVCVSFHTKTHTTTHPLYTERYVCAGGRDAAKKLVKNKGAEHAMCSIHKFRQVCIDKSVLHMSVSHSHMVTTSTATYTQRNEARA